MRWNVLDNWPPIAGMGVTVLCDGAEVPDVRALDTHAGWVERYCRGGHTGHAGEKHLDASGTGVCTVRLEGKVEVRLSDKAQDVVRACQGPASEHASLGAIDATDLSQEARYWLGTRLQAAHK